MSNISLLDCTLRDGGYINNWKFGKNNMTTIIKKLSESGADIIEVGYLTREIEEDSETAKFCSIDSAYKRLQLDSYSTQTFAIMINYGEFPIEMFEKCERKIIIRVAFHKKDMDEALDYISKLIDLGYSVFVQPMGVLSYSDNEFIDMIKRVNKIMPSAFYIVDSFGVIELYDFKRLVFLADNNLKKVISLGYHSHNNLQQAYSNSKFLVEQHLSRNVIVDASIFGMGRGAGNLNEELFERFLNKYYGKQYRIEPLLEAFDECLRPIFLTNFWGYSFPFYLSSIHNCHPNYANFFIEKNTLSVKSLNELLNSISDNDKISFSRDKANYYYENYMKNYVDDEESINELSNFIQKRKVLVIAPGASLNNSLNQIHRFIDENNPVTIGVSRMNNGFLYDFLFISNEKRVVGLSYSSEVKLIKTSNLLYTSEPRDLIVNYSSYLSDDEVVSDNSGLMLIRLLIKAGCTDVYLCGFDGYSLDSATNYFDSSLSLGTNGYSKIEKNKAMKKQIEKLRKQIRIVFVTASIYDNNN